jgi:hypothetical protein
MRPPSQGERDAQLKRELDEHEQEVAEQLEMIRVQVTTLARELGIE